MNIPVRILLIFCLLTAAFVTRAATVPRMFEVSLPVINQERDIRQAAFEQAFIEVLVRVSGNSQVPTQVDISRAASYVQQYRYLALAPAPAPVETPNDAEAAKFTLWIQFNEAAVAKLLRDSNLPVWGKQRPNVLIWLAVRDGRNRYVLKDADASVIKDVVNREAIRRGLPLQWPQYDATDKQALGFADIWGGFWDPVVQASKRYAADAILLGRMDWTGSGWQMNWSLWLEQKSEQWNLSAVELDMLMASGINLATDQIASRFAVLQNTTDEGRLIVQVNGVSNVASYARIARYLQSLVPVKHVFVTEVEQQQVKFHLDIAGSRDDLQRLIALDKTLVPDVVPITPPPPNPDAVPTPEQPAALAVLYYKLNR
ncbi:MAG: DUF2066 domain-containing protein [Gammaproteobacteria bacterium]|nr:MAG: DUF2066 domain-containing protein [Gammaproteobacteria bacterium]